ncbi:hypothetical protein [Nocardiopsis baichengensis]|uniref:hypothetical protein n=1 Tax=Nocardiopsis baichengensis TaxID=280240 RepID=UPI0003654EC1|nr:hypothetical protein [Nocardiopsis baichengensis]
MSDDLDRLDQLDTDELRERAFALARHRWDVQFFWRLLRSIPAAEAAAGHLEAGEAGIATASARVGEALSAEADPELQEALRPLYIAYLDEHGPAPD